MKKPLLAFTFLLLATAAHAQRRDVSLGLKAGATYSSFVGKQAGGYNNALGFHAGGFANIGLTSLFAFQPEIIYSQKGAELPILDGTTRLHYVDIPLVFHVNADGLFFEAGPQVGALVAASDKVGNVTIDRKGLYNDLDVGYVIGLGYQRKTGPGIGLRYNGGFTNVEKSLRRGAVTVQNNIRNSALQLYLSYSFNR